PVLRTLQRGVARLHQDIGTTCDKNHYTLDYLLVQGKQQAEAEKEESGDITMQDVFASFDDNDSELAEDSEEPDSEEHEERGSGLMDVDSSEVLARA
ncbi:hypothetical protein GGH99_006878, partial [Coemansia sp. RSA 1285]